MHACRETLQSCSNLHLYSDHRGHIGVCRFAPRATAAASRRAYSRKTVIGESTRCDTQAAQNCQIEESIWEEIQRPGRTCTPRVRRPLEGRSVLVVIVMIVIVMIVVVITIPVLLGLPSVFSSIPPLMIFIPAALPFRIQVPSPFIGFAAVLAIPLDRSIESLFRFFDRVLTPASIVVGPGLRCRCKKPKCSSHYECHCCP